MATYTGDSLDKLRKQDLIPIILTLESQLKIKITQFWRKYVNLMSQFESCRQSWL